MAQRPQRDHTCNAYLKNSLKMGWQVIPTRCGASLKGDNVFCGRHARSGPDLLTIPREKCRELVDVTLRRTERVDFQAWMNFVDGVLHEALTTLSVEGTDNPVVGPVVVPPAGPCVVKKD
tara:strand:- start:316 stop:675 length:360 start_codon:yes stop_codon:yes gene_type:complete